MHKKHQHGIYIAYQQSWKNKVTDFARSRNVDENVAEDRYTWRLRMDKRLLAVYILIKVIINIKHTLSIPYI